MTDHSKNKVEELKKVLEGKKKEREEIQEGPRPEEEAKQNYDKYLRAVAELENFKKRSAKELSDHLRYSHEVLLKELLKVVDDFDRIMAHLPKEESPAIQGLIEGIQLVYRDCMNVLKKFGLQEIEAKKGKFDPHVHEAISQVESETVQEGEIVETHRKGYLLHDRLLRPAAVTVAKAKVPEETNGE